MKINRKPDITQNLHKHIQEKKLLDQEIKERKAVRPKSRLNKMNKSPIKKNENIDEDGSQNNIQVEEMKELRCQRMDLEQKTSQLSKQMDAVHNKIKNQMNKRNKNKEVILEQYKKKNENHKIEMVYFAAKKLQDILNNYVFQRHYKSSSRFLFQQLKINNQRLKKQEKVFNNLFNLFEQKRMRHFSFFYVKLVKFNQKYEQVQKSLLSDEENEEFLQKNKKVEQFVKLKLFVKYFNILKNDLFNSQLQKHISQQTNKYQQKTENFLEKLQQNIQQQDLQVEQKAEQKTEQKAEKIADNTQNGSIRNSSIKKAKITKQTNTLLELEKRRMQRIEVQKTLKEKKEQEKQLKEKQKIEKDVQYQQELQQQKRYEREQYFQKIKQKEQIIIDKQDQIEKQKNDIQQANEFKDKQIMKRGFKKFKQIIMLTDLKMNKMRNYYDDSLQRMIFNQFKNQIKKQKHLKIQQDASKMNTAIQFYNHKQLEKTLE